MYKIFFYFFMIFFSLTQAVAKDVVVSVRPLYYLVQSVLGDTQKAVLLLNSNSSPHSFSLKPSHIRMLNKAKVVFYIDDDFETFLQKTLHNLPKKTNLVSVTSMPNISLLELRDDAKWGKHTHHHSEHKDEHNVDFHLWLDINNAKNIVINIANILSKMYPQDKDIFQKNAKIQIVKMQKLHNNIISKFDKLKIHKKPYIVFHDAYQYFEKQYNLNSVGAITINPHSTPSISHIRKIRARLKKQKVMCIFKEPQFPDKLIDLIKNNTNTKVSSLDPIGTSMRLENGSYVKLMQNIASNFSNCLK